MNEQDDNTVDRRSVMTGVGIVVAGLAAGATAAHAQTGKRHGGTRFQPARHKLDAWFDELPGNHRVFIDSDTADGGANALGYANNLYLARDSAYAGESADAAIVVCFRHFSTPFGYGDAIWAKYGDIFHSLIQYPDPATGAAPKINLMNSAAHKNLSNRGVTIDALAAKGTQFAVCNMATQFIAGAIAGRTGAKADDVHAELVAGAIGKAHFVSAGVMALTRAQEYGYSLLVAG
jgi:intracellular sulfur oxidation DsrE/DsrF family protein